MLASGYHKGGRLRTTENHFTVNESLPNWRRNLALWTRPKKKSRSVLLGGISTNSEHINTRIVHDFLGTMNSSLFKQAHKFTCGLFTRPFRL